MLVYKYTKFNENSIKLLTNGEFYFSNPENFNDPFDSVINYKTFNTLEEQTLFYKQCYKQKIIHKNVFELWENFIKKIDRKTNLIKSIQQKSVLSKQIAFQLNSNICCFSSTNNCIQMWSHYGDNHKGVCFGFKTIKQNNFEWILFDDKDLICNVEVENFKAFPIYPVSYSYKMPTPIVTYHNIDPLIITLVTPS